jgi:hypothetical protein
MIRSRSEPKPGITRHTIPALISFDCGLPEIDPPTDYSAHKLYLNDLDLSYTPPLGSPWDAAQVGTQAWSRALRLGRSAEELAHA